MTTLEVGRRIAINNVLFATDFSSHSDVALPYALAIAQQFGAKVYGAHVVNSQDCLFTAPEVWPAFAQQEEQLKEDTEARLEKQLAGVPHEALFGVGDVWNVLSRLIGEHSIDLLVVGTHGRTGARKLLMGSVAERIFRQAACPVLSVGPNVVGKTDGKITFERILFATNFGEESLAALPFALSLAEENEAELVLFHVADPSTALLPNTAAIKASLVRRLERLVPDEASSWCHVECLVAPGEERSTAERIVDAARSLFADLIVLGARTHHGGLTAVTHLSNTTAQSVVAHAGCPVLTIRG